MLNPSRNVGLALLAYIVGGVILTLALGDLGDVGFWIAWIPLVLFASYLIVVGIARLAGTARPAN